MKNEPPERIMIPMAVFLLAIGVHFWLFAALAAQTAGEWTIKQEFNPFGSYVATNEVLLGISYGIMAAFTSYVALLFFQKRAALSQLVTSMGFTAALYAFGCFMVGCCGSPMLAIYLGFFGPGIAGLSKPIVLVASAVSAAYGYRSLGRFREKEETKKKNACIDESCACSTGAKKDSDNLTDTIAFAFVGVVAILILAEIAVENTGLLDKPLGALPVPIIVAATLVGGYPIFKSAFSGLRAGKITADLLMCIGIGAAMLTGEFAASTLIVFFMGIAHFLEDFTFQRARGAIAGIIALAPKSARVRRNGEETEIAADEVKVGDILIVKPGERLSADGIVISGSGSVDESPITGESVPKEKQAGSEVFAASVNQFGSFEIEVRRTGGDTVLGRIIHMVEEAETSKAPVQKFADRFSSYYLPVVSLSALGTYLLTGNIMHTIAVLVVACPCAIALATPMSVVAAVGNAAKNGIIVKGGLYLENLSKVDTLLVDKTGTLTYGKPQITDILVKKGRTTEDVLCIAASLESHSEHPLARAVLERAEKEGVSYARAAKFHYLVGRGISGTVGGKPAVVGNDALMAAHGIDPSGLSKDRERLESEGKTVLVVAKGGEAIGLIAVSDILRKDVAKALDELRALGIGRIVLITGDNERVAAAAAKYCGITEYRANQLPHDKFGYVKELQKEGRRVLMIGDGVNDAPAIAQADVGIAMGSGTDVSIETSDIVLMRDEWGQVPVAVRISRKAFSTIKQNIAVGVVFNVLGISLASAGILTPIFAAMAQSLPDVMVFLNSSRLLFLKKGR